MQHHYLYTIVLLCLTLTLHSQRGEMPDSNPGNIHNLKVVSQEYTVTNGYGQKIRNGQYLNLKVNDMYFPGGVTGIYEENFRKYLSDCPKALDLGLDGLNLYGSSKKNDRIGKIALWGGLGSALIIGLRTQDSDSNIGRPLAIGLGLGGIATRLILNQRVKKLDKQGNEKVIEAFDLYNESCYNDTNTRKSGASDTTEPTVENGESNSDEIVRLDPISNNVDEGIFSIGAFGGAYVMDTPKLTFGPELGYFKKGLQINAEAGLLLPSDEAIEDREFYLSSTVSVPIFKKKKKRNDVFYLGNIGSLLASAEVEDVLSYTFLSLEGGIEHYRQHSDVTFIDEYFGSSTLLRGGLSFSFFNEFSFNVDDNRFSDYTRYNIRNVKFYAHLLYNQSTEYDILASTFVSEAPSHEDLGFALGLLIRYGKRFKNGALYTRVEGGNYPIQQEELLRGIGVQFTLGYEFYSMKR